MLAYQLDIVLPCYNPATGWATSIIASITQLQQLLPDTEIFIYLVNDGSTSGVMPTDIELLHKTLNNFNYIAYQQNQGKGYALRLGVKAAPHKYCIYTDVDFPFEESSFVQIYQALRNGQADVVAGVRDKNYYINIPGIRSKISKLFRFVIQKTLQLPVYDTQCGIKGFNNQGRKIFLETTIKRYLFDFEFILAAAKSPPIRVCPVQVSLKPDITFGTLSFGILVTESLSYFKLMLQKRNLGAASKQKTEFSQKVAELQNPRF